MKRACWYLMYNMAEPRDAFYIKLEQINFSKKTMEYRDKTYDLSDKCLEAINYLHSPAYRFDLHRDIAGAEYALVNSATDREKMFISVKTAASAYFRRLKETICRNSSDSTGNPMPAIMKLGKRHLWAGCCRQIISAGWTTFRICLRNPLLNL